MSLHCTIWQFCELQCTYQRSLRRITGVEHSGATAENGSPDGNEACDESKDGQWWFYGHNCRIRILYAKNIVEWQDFRGHVALCKMFYSCIDLHACTYVELYVYALFIHVCNIFIMHIFVRVVVGLVVHTTNVQRPNTPTMVNIDTC